MYISIEGQDATGKDTQSLRLADYLRAKGQTVVTYAESGTASSDPFVSTIAQQNYGTAQNIDHKTRSLLFLVNRYHQWKTIAEPALAQGHTVITTRYWYSTLIYEGYVGGVDPEIITKMHRLLMPERYFHPDKIVILTLPDHERQKRLSAQGRRQTEVFKSMNQTFQKQVNAQYLRIAQEFQVPTLDTTGSLEEVTARLIEFFHF